MSGLIEPEILEHLRKVSLTGNVDEVVEGSSFIKNEVHPGAEIIWGMVFDDNMDDVIRITVIATGISDIRDRNVINIRDLTPEERDEDWTVRPKESLDKPEYQRRLAEQDGDRPLNEKGLNPGKKGILHRVFQRENLEYPTFLRKQVD